MRQSVDLDLVFSDRVCVIGIFPCVYVRKCVHSGIVACSGVNSFVSATDVPFINASQS